jgi:hypothetical protein
VGGAELEPFGTNAGLFKGFMMPPPPSRATLEAEMNYPFFSNMGTGLCTVDRIESPCYMFGLDAVALRAVNQPNPGIKEMDFLQETIRRRSASFCILLTRKVPVGEVINEIWAGITRAFLEKLCTEERM